jgi:hypothetical protein
MALWMGRPVARFQRTVVSRWFVMPMAAIASPPTSALLSANVTASATERQTSSTSCSTHPGFGKCCGNSKLWRPSVFPVRERTMAVVPVVPWSMARRCSDMGREDAPGGWSWSRTTS